jgi:hypothetical protein
MHGAWVDAKNSNKQLLGSSEQTEEVLAIDDDDDGC